MINEAERAYYSRPFPIQYCDEEVDLNEGVVFATEIDLLNTAGGGLVGGGLAGGGLAAGKVGSHHGQVGGHHGPAGSQTGSHGGMGPNGKEDVLGAGESCVYLDFALLFAESKHPSGSEEFVEAAFQTLKVVNPHLGTATGYRLTFDSFHSSVTTISVITCLADIKRATARRDLSLTAPVLPVKAFLPKAPPSLKYIGQAAVGSHNGVQGGGNHAGPGGAGPPGASVEKKLNAVYDSERNVALALDADAPVYGSQERRVVETEGYRLPKAGSWHEPSFHDYLCLFGAGSSEPLPVDVGQVLRDRADAADKHFQTLLLRSYFVLAALTHTLLSRCLVPADAAHYSWLTGLSPLHLPGGLTVYCGPDGLPDPKEPFKCPTDALADTSAHTLSTHGVSLGDRSAGTRSAGARSAGGRSAGGREGTGGSSRRGGLDRALENQRTANLRNDYARNSGITDSIHVTVENRHLPFDFENKARSCHRYCSLSRDQRSPSPSRPPSQSKPPSSRRRPSESRLTHLADPLLGPRPPSATGHQLAGGGRAGNGRIAIEQPLERMIDGRMIDGRIVDGRVTEEQYGRSVGRNAAGVRGGARESSVNSRARTTASATPGMKGDWLNGSVTLCLPYSPLSGRARIREAHRTLTVDLEAALIDNVNLMWAQVAERWHKLCMLMCLAQRQACFYFELLQAVKEQEVLSRVFRREVIEKGFRHVEPDPAAFHTSISDQYRLCCEWSASAVEDCHDPLNAKTAPLIFEEVYLAAGSRTSPPLGGGPISSSGPVLGPSVGLGGPSLGGPSSFTGPSLSGPVGVVTSPSSRCHPDLCADTPGDWLDEAVPFEQVTSPQLPMSPLTHLDPKTYEGLHLIILVHGFKGNSFDLRIFKNSLQQLYPEHVYLLSAVNENRTDDDIEEQAERLSQEVYKYVTDLCSWANIGRVSFIAHSLGGLIVRAAIPRLCKIPDLNSGDGTSVKDKLHLYMSLSSPHLGYTAARNKLVDAGLWVLKKFKRSVSLAQICANDHKDYKQTFLYRLSKNGALRFFDHVILVSSPQDNYVPYESARVEFSQRVMKDPIWCTIHHDLVTNIMADITHNPQAEETNRFLRIDVCFRIAQKNLDSIIGRTAHINFLSCEQLAYMLTSKYASMLS
ncbi:putative serine esterase [Gregarina niphandrodes]|uniref:Serine esterase n=1 Tax=Gregarina niphandrodes TaxID=110365 RepID=A0A023BBV5_GRENI|nr:putative serine esterase [Gregarina niphandrodes]EZG80086.1 putative serine esterase [Gregarina niphandrodes]|eukprot:XP_011134335.1 putative serine esterase [Gregarina niphandrodes]